VLLSEWRHPHWLKFGVTDDHAAYHHDSCTVPLFVGSHNLPRCMAGGRRAAARVAPQPWRTPAMLILSSYKEPLAPRLPDSFLFCINPPSSLNWKQRITERVSPFCGAKPSTWLNPRLAKRTTPPPRSNGNTDLTIGPRRNQLPLLHLTTRVKSAKGRSLLTRAIKKKVWGR
jgi:hypothetical protein